jgi:hypothetical protein
MTVGKISPLSSRQASFSYKDSKISRLLAAAKMNAADFSPKTFSKDVFLEKALDSGVCSVELIDEILGTDECEFKLASPADSEGSGNFLSNKFEECIEPYKSSFDDFENDHRGVFLCPERIKVMRKVNKRLEEFSKMLPNLTSKWAQLTVQISIGDFSTDRCGRDWRGCSDTISFLQQFFRCELFRRLDEHASDGISIFCSPAEEEMQFVRRLAIHAVAAYEEKVDVLASSELAHVLWKDANAMKRHISQSDRLDEKTKGLLLEKADQIVRVCWEWNPYLYSIAISDMHQLLSDKIQEMRAVRRNMNIDK